MCVHLRAYEKEPADAAVRDLGLPFSEHAAVSVVPVETQWSACT